MADPEPSRRDHRVVNAERQTWRCRRELKGKLVAQAANQPSAPQPQPLKAGKRPIGLPHRGQARLQFSLSSPTLRELRDMATDISKLEFPPPISLNQSLA